MTLEIELHPGAVGVALLELGGHAAVEFEEPVVVSASSLGADRACVAPHEVVQLDAFSSLRSELHGRAFTGFIAGRIWLPIVFVVLFTLELTLWGWGSIP